MLWFMIIAVLVPGKFSCFVSPSIFIYLSFESVVVLPPAPPPTLFNFYMLGVRIHHAWLTHGLLSKKGIWYRKMLFLDTVMLRPCRSSIYRIIIFPTSVFNILLSHITSFSLLHWKMKNWYLHQMHCGLTDMEHYTWYPNRYVGCWDVLQVLFFTLVRNILGNFENGKHFFFRYLLCLL